MTLSRSLPGIEIPCVCKKIFLKIASFPKGVYFPRVEYIDMRKFKGKEVF
jgi:hypothetical protein